MRTRVDHRSEELVVRDAFAAHWGADGAWFLAQDHAIMDTVNEVVRAFDGSFSAEHGIGKLKPYMMPDWRGGAELAMMQRIKAALDPQGILNPGKVLPPRPRAAKGG